MDDLINREEAYKVLTDYYHHKTDVQHKALRDALSRVPSAQPEIIRCKDCKWYDTAMPMTEGFCYCDKFGLVFGYNDFCSRVEKREG